MAWRYRFVWSLPLVWGALMVGAVRWHGDEYGATLFAALAALPLGLGLRQFELHESLGTLGAIWVCGLPVIAPLGLLLDRARVSVFVFAAGWLGLAAALGFAWAASYGSVQAAVSKNGSLLAYAFAGLGSALPVVALFTSSLRWLGPVGATPDSSVATRAERARR